MFPASDLPVALRLAVQHDNSITQKGPVHICTQLTNIDRGTLLAVGCWLLMAQPRVQSRVDSWHFRLCFCEFLAGFPFLITIPLLLHAHLYGRVLKSATAHTRRTVSSVFMSVGFFLKRWAMR
jgi:hypothetical protein